MTLFSTPSIFEPTPKFNDDYWLSMDDNYEELKEKRKVEFLEDPLVLSCTLYRLIKEDDGTGQRPRSGWSLTVDSGSLLKYVTEEDRKLALDIRNDFQGKLVYFMIKVGKLSKFKNDLNFFLNADFKYEGEDKYIMPEKYVGMVYKLPYFYEYNKSQEALFVDQPKELMGLDRFDDVVQVTYLARLDSKVHKEKNKWEYWFVGPTGARITVEIDKSNALIDILEFVKDRPLTLTARFNKRTHYSSQYYVTSKWKLSL